MFLRSYKRSPKRHKRSSERSISEVAPRFRNICMCVQTQHSSEEAFCFFGRNLPICGTAVLQTHFRKKVPNICVIYRIIEQHMQHLPYYCCTRIPGHLHVALLFSVVNSTETPTALSPLFTSTINTVPLSSRTTVLSESNPITTTRGGVAYYNETMATRGCSKL